MLRVCTVYMLGVMQNFLGLYRHAKFNHVNELKTKQMRASKQIEDVMMLQLVYIFYLD